MARQTPAYRNRYVDFLRALSINAVVFGHWLLTAPYVVGGEIRLGNILEIQPWTHALTLLFQVMPAFFIVGGYSNAASWTSYGRSGRGYAAWLHGRLVRLAAPVAPLLLFWTAGALIALGAGLDARWLHETSKLAMVPLWFLAVYIGMVLLVPLTWRAWERFGRYSLWLPAAAAVGVDLLRFGGGHTPSIGWINYLFVWITVHQLGHLWYAEDQMPRSQALVWATGGIAAFAALTLFGPYPLAMVSVPGAEVSNTLPPDIMLLALTAAQWGLLRALEGPVRRRLQGEVPWTATVLVNSMIMTVFLWHSTAMVVLIGGAVLAGGPGLGLLPGSGGWWLLRPLWLAALMLLLTVMVGLFGRFERMRGMERDRSVLRLVPATLLFCFALALLALDGLVFPGASTVRVGALAAAGVGLFAALV